MRFPVLASSVSALVLAFGTAGSTRTFGRWLDVVVEVRDDSGAPVEGAWVRLGFPWHLAVDQIARVEHTDQKGRVHIRERIGVGEDLWVSVNKDGHENQNFHVVMAEAKEAGWDEAEPLVVQAVLHRIQPPRPGYRRVLREQRIPVNRPARGFDLMVSDWVAPYGKGESEHLRIRLEHRPDVESESRLRLVMASGDPDGGMARSRDRIHQSERLGHRTVYRPRPAPLQMAPEDGYVPALRWGGDWDGGEIPQGLAVPQYLKVPAPLMEDQRTGEARFGWVADVPNPASDGHIRYRYLPLGRTWGHGVLDWSYFLGLPSDRRVRPDGDRNLHGVSRAAAALLAGTKAPVTRDISDREPGRVAGAFGLLEETEPHLRTHGVRILVWEIRRSGIEDPRSDFTEQMLRALGHGEWYVRNLATRVLALSAGTRSDALHAALGHEDPRVRRHAAEAAGLHGDEKAVPRLIELLKDDHPPCAWHAALALGRIGHPDASDGLVATLGHGHPGVRGFAAEALGRLGSPTAVRHLLEAADDPDDGVRRRSVWAMGELGGEAALARVHQALEDPCLDVRLAALVALRKIGNAETLDRIEELAEQEGPAMLRLRAFTRARAAIRIRIWEEE